MYLPHITILTATTAHNTNNHHLQNVLYLDQNTNKLFFSKNGGAKFTEVDTNGQKIKYLVEHPHKPGHAFAISDDTTHFKTVSQGMTWKKFTTPEKAADASIETFHDKHSPIVFHGKRDELLLFAGGCIDSNEDSCERQYYYTNNNFDEIRPLVKAYSCIFSDATPSSEVSDSNLITCIVGGEAGVDKVLARSHDFFSTRQYVPWMAGLITNVQKLGYGSHNLIAVGAHLVDDKSTFVYVSYDGYQWDRVEFPEGKLSDDYTVVEGTAHSLFVDVKYAGTDKVGELFFSGGVNSSFFTQSLQYTHRDGNGNVDYELVDNIDGVVLANTVENAPDVIAENVAPVIKSKISFNQGASWTGLRADGSNLHLHSLVQRAINFDGAPGKYFSSPVPGILLGVGNTGDSLKSYEEGDTYISTDAGLTWSKTLNGPHLFEFGDQGSIIVAIEDNADTNVIKYTINMGQSWQQVSLGSTVRAKYITTTPDSTTFRFLLVATTGGRYTTYALDFNGLYPRKCGDNDFEDFYVKDAQSNEPMCILGHKQKFKRRIRSADCRVDKQYKEAVAVEDSCPCTKSDFVCSLNFKKNSDGTCVPLLNSLTDAFARDAMCINNSPTYVVPAAYIKQPGNVCSTTQGVSLAGDVEKKCPNYETEKGSSGDHKKIDYDLDDSPDETDRDSNPEEKEGDKKKAEDGKNDGRVKTSSFAFSGQIKKYEYLDRVKGSNLRDETIVLLTTHNKAYVTHDQGSSWEQIAPDDEILDIIVNPYNANHVYLLSTNMKIIYSTDRADNWKFFRTPANYVPGTQPLQFHPKHSNWFIYIGQLGCENAGLQGACRTATYYTKSYGKRFAKLQEHVNTCQFIGHLLEPTDEQLIICTREENENTIHNNELIVSTDFFATHDTPLHEVVGFVQSDDYLVAATVQNDGSLRAHVSVDGEHWTDALFPANIRVDKQQAYTVLSSKSHAIFIHVTTNQRDNSEFGALLKSNSNGTSYVMSNQFVNRDYYGFVDFEQLENLEGVAVINSVSNPKAAKQGARKQLKTLITHNDGADWDLLTPPSVDSEGKKYECTGKSLDECALHLHGYTERADYRDTFSSGSAVGMMLAVGNVGDRLGNYLDGHTFLTRDGGVTWKEVKKGVYQWEYGDQGSIIVLVNGQDSTNTLSYSLDEGKTWSDYQFSDDLVSIIDISTVPSDDSRRFLLFTKLPTSRGDKSTVYQIDFSQLLKRKCNLDLANPDTDDFDLWTPKHPHMSDNCLFGHEAQYYRKIAGKDCYIGEKLDKPFEVIRNCACTRQDYECDFNYFRDNNGECKLITGYTPPDHSSVCKQMDVDEYWLPTGYRKIPLSTCEGGHEFDKVEAQPCPGKEDEFKQKHKGLTGLSLFLVIVIPIGGVATVLYVIYHHYVGRYGQIKLGDEQEFEFDNSSPLNKFTSVVGFAVVATVGFAQQFGSTIYSFVDHLYGRAVRRAIVLDEETASLHTTYPESAPEDDDVLDQTDIEDNELLDDPDLNETGDDRL
ncbi:CYFA0S06e02960g1_1 [Cyberlindnera fabianii]|uniref:CYFA0S06e02960g1_1 n=1 Tax=Cyberlindnera fabianii TaxID=36022 RepID=A0A061AUC0_CYBFA|nr:CYFA0S06e02960g1_1 [Cyberlindnera fabianii]